MVYTMMTMAAMLAIGISLSGLFISKLKRARSVYDSAIAIYAADSVTERCLYEARHSGPPQTLSLLSGITYTIVGGPTFATNVTADCSSLAADTFQFRVTGTYRGVSRALEISQ